MIIVVAIALIVGVVLLYLDIKIRRPWAEIDKMMAEWEYHDEFDYDW